MGKAGRALALNKFDLKIIVPQIVNLYRVILNYENKLKKYFVK